jgi:hypothetical protein
VTRKNKVLACAGTTHAGIEAHLHVMGAAVQCGAEPTRTPHMKPIVAAAQAHPGSVLPIDAPHSPPVLHVDTDL